MRELTHHLYWSCQLVWLAFRIQRFINQQHHQALRALSVIDEYQRRGLAPPLPVITELEDANLKVQDSMRLLDWLKKEHARI